MKSNKHILDDEGSLSISRKPRPEPSESKSRLGLSDEENPLDTDGELDHFMQNKQSEKSHGTAQAFNRQIGVGSERGNKSHI